jgi:hypothetical protein
MLKLVIRSALAAIVFAAGVLAVAAPAGATDELASARAATAGYHELGAAQDAGYTVVVEDVNHITCISDPNGTGGMGVHYVDPNLLFDHGVIDAEHPEAVIYEPTSRGPRLVAVEYIVFARDWQGAEPPSLFGQQFELVPSGNRYGLPTFYELHAWLWRHNPNGMFDDWNPHVVCP